MKREGVEVKMTWEYLVILYVLLIVKKYLT